MSEPEHSLPDQSTYILVAAGNHDEPVIALVRALREAGLRITFAETVNVAARASEAAACVVILTPDTWKAQTIATVMRAKPTCLIPVLAEEMDLPRGPWTHEAIRLDNNLSQAEQELIQALQSYLAALPHTATVKLSSTDELTLTTILARNKHRRMRNTGVLLTCLLFLVIIGLGSLLGHQYYMIQQNPVIATPDKSLNPGSPTIATHNTYTATIPGDPCDLGGGQWEIGDRYKKDKNTEILDKYTSLQCQHDGALLTRSGEYGVYSEIFFDGPGPYLSLTHHFRVQFDATIVSGDAQANIGIDTHVNSGYGRYSFDINTLGHWEAHVNSTDGVNYLKRLAIGFLPKSTKTYTLALETDGAIMTFFVNNKKVTSVIDTTYSDNDSIAFGINDSTAKKTISARFSHFIYEELPPATLTESQAFATATTQTRSNLQTVYKTHIPGYGCDHGAGQWQSLADEQITGGLHCTSSGLQLTAPAKARYIIEEDFYWLNGFFPSNYKISAHITVTAATSGCAGLSTRNGEQSGFYAFVICPDGSWEIALVTDKYHTLAEGWTTVQNTYEITAEAKGSSQSLFINGSLIKTIKDSHLKNTDHLSLLSGLRITDLSSTATFSDFVFTPLP